MIEATYYRDMHKLIVRGHARSDEPGKDLVCASASILTYTFGKAVAEFESSGSVRDASVMIDEGNAEISCNPKNGMRHVVTLVLDSICGGFTLLSKSKPEFISFRIAQK